MGACRNNFGCSIKEEILGKTGRVIPSMLDYEKHIKAESMYNTPPVFAVYASLANPTMVKKKAALAAIEKINEAKAAIYYILKLIEIHYLEALL